MKNMRHILSSIKNKSYFKKFQTNVHLDSLKNALPNSLKQYLHSLYIKNGVLFFVFDNPSLIMEFNHKKDFIKSVIKKIEEINNIDLNITNLQSIAPKKLYMQKLNKAVEKPVSYVFEEKSLGNYKNNLSDSELFDKLESIRGVIKRSFA